MNITKITKNTNTIYEVNKKDSLITFEGHNYNINDNATARNLIYMLIDKCIDNDNLIDDYKRIVKNKEEAIRLLEKDIKEYYQDLKECQKTNVKLRDNNKQLERDIRQSDNLLGECLDDKMAIEKEKNKIEDSIKIFFRLNEKIIK
jgi:septal ring factor EnvC (AmiA/AmiB activator)